MQDLGMFTDFVANFISVSIFLFYIDFQLKYLCPIYFLIILLQIYSIQQLAQSNTLSDTRTNTVSNAVSILVSNNGRTVSFSMLCLISLFAKYLTFMFYPHIHAYSTTFPPSSAPSGFPTVSCQYHMTRVRLLCTSSHISLFLYSYLIYQAPPSLAPSQSPSDLPSLSPTAQPSGEPSFSPSGSPTDVPTSQPSSWPTVSCISLLFFV